jgi:hypothetical protein
MRDRRGAVVPSMPQALVAFVETYMKLQKTTRDVEERMSRLKGRIATRCNLHSIRTYIRDV